MTTNTTNQTTLNASYGLNPANGEIKVVVTRKKEADVKLQTRIRYVKTHYSIDTNGGGYTGL